MKRSILSSAAILLLVLVGAIAVSMIRSSRPLPLAQATEEPVIVLINDTSELADYHNKGATLAAEEINAAGGVLGIKLQLRAVTEPPLPPTATDTQRVSNALSFAQHVVADRNVIAVIGYALTNSLLPAASVYEAAGRILMTRYSAHISVSNHGYQSIFLLQPNERGIMHLLIDYARDQGYHRILVLNDGTPAGLDAARVIAAEAEPHDIHVALNADFHSGGGGIEEFVRRLLESPTLDMPNLDAIMINATAEQTGEFLREARRVGIKIPVIGSDRITSPEAQAIAGDAMRNTIGIYAFDPHTTNEPARGFVARFTARFGIPPNQQAAMGYDAVKLLAEAATRAESLDPIKMRDVLHNLRYTKPFPGVTGNLAFAHDGEILGREVYIVRNDGHGFAIAHTYDTD